MAENVNLKTESTEEVAYKLYTDVVGAENHPHHNMSASDARKYLLDLFAECLQATRGYRK